LIPACALRPASLRVVLYVIYITVVGEKQARNRRNETILPKPRNDPETHAA
jgi:hypothetical protein